MINEEISTIFVVGFPDDMQEREFQNMFIFARGFEAATLKIPQKDSSADENDDESSANGSNGTSNARKQIIGFAKFRSRSEALEARDALSGRKVDAEKGSVLKAEMAKKNLHTKRGLSNDQNNAAYPLVPATKQFSTPPNINTNTVNYDAYQYGAPALPSDLLSPQDYGYDDFYSDVSVYTPTTPTTPVFPDQSPFATARGSFDATNGTPIGGLVSAPRSLINGAGVRYNAKAFLDNDELNYLPKSNPVEILPQKVSNSGFQSALLVNDELSNRVAVQLMMNSAQQQMPPTGISPSPALSSPAFRPLNPADQNPPCNTLYVGNLPMNTNEDELKELFSKCLGYKRMCFRTKQNGPICFVEFEDVNYATQAMTSLYGSFLSNSIKSGIRLSFSKNPLGVRSNNGERRGSNFSLDSRRDSWNSFDSTINFERRGSFDNFLQRRGSGFLDSQNMFNAEHRRSSAASFLNSERRESNYSPFDY